MKVIDESKLSETLQFILDYQTREGKTPTYRVIQDGCNFSSLAVVSRYINHLKKRNLIKMEDNGGWKQIALPDFVKKKGSHNTFIVGAVRCGQPSEAIEDIEACVALPDEIFGSAEHVILHAKGPSMINRGIFDGDLLVVRLSSVADYGQTIVAILDDQEATCKIYARKNNKDYLKAANDETENGKRVYDVYPTGDWTIYGIVEFVIHKPVRDEL